MVLWHFVFLFWMNVWILTLTSHIVWPAILNVPWGQITGEIAGSTQWYPGEHTIHDDIPVALAYVPAAQLTGELDVVGQYDPFSHGIQLVPLVYSPAWNSQNNM